MFKPDICVSFNLSLSLGIVFWLESQILTSFNFGNGHQPDTQSSWPPNHHLCLGMLALPHP
jgi:hypothetical protein